MQDFKRLVSYIYSYPGGVKDKNVGFAKAEVRNGVFNLNISLSGVYVEVPENFTVYLIFERTKETDTYNLLPLDNILIKSGQGTYADVINPDNIASSGYTFSQIKGLAILQSKMQYYTMFSLWEKDEINPSKCVLLPKGFKLEEVAEASSEELASAGVETSESEESVEEEASVEAEIPVEPVKVSKPVREVDPIYGDTEKIFENMDCINAFDDDYFFDCIEVSPETLKKYVPDDISEENSFMMHSYYTYRHLLFGRVCDNTNNTHYFIGVPGMYSNRERYLATMFGFNNFKKSHRSDYPNPYFGYWYTEI